MLSRLGNFCNKLSDKVSALDSKHKRFLWAAGLLLVTGHINCKKPSPKTYNLQRIIVFEAVTHSTDPTLFVIIKLLENLLVVT
jgi:hypothetical protein